MRCARLFDLPEDLALRCGRLQAVRPRSGGLQAIRAFSEGVVILPWRTFYAGDRVVYWDRRAERLVRAEVVRPLITACLVKLARDGREVLIVNDLLRKCPVRLAYCRPHRLETPRGVA